MVCTVNPVGKVEVVAKWKDGRPLVAIRYDMTALITSITFSCGNNIFGSRDGLAVVLNSLSLFK